MKYIKYISRACIVLAVGLALGQVIKPKVFWVVFFCVLFLKATIEESIKIRKYLKRTVEYDRVFKSKRNFYDLYSNHGIYVLILFFLSFKYSEFLDLFITILLISELPKLYNVVVWAINPNFLFLKDDVLIINRRNFDSVPIKKIKDIKFAPGTHVLHIYKETGEECSIHIPDFNPNEIHELIELIIESSEYNLEWPYHYLKYRKKLASRRYTS